MPEQQTIVWREWVTFPELGSLGILGALRIKAKIITGTSRRGAEGQ